MKRQLFFFKKFLITVSSVSGNGHKIKILKENGKLKLKIKYWLKVHSPPRMSTTVSTGLFNASGALTSPVINANTVNITNPTQFLTPSNGLSQVSVNVAPTVTSLANKVLVIQGGSQTTAFMTGVAAAKLGAKVYALARTKYWFDQDVEAYNAGMFYNSPTSTLQDASSGLIQATYTNNDASANVINDRLPTVTFPGSSGFIKFLAMDARIPYVEKLDLNPTTHAGYIANASKYAAQPYLKELAWFTVDTSGGSNFGKDCPGLSARGAFQYVMNKHLYITEVMALGGCGSQWALDFQSFVNVQVRNTGTDSTNTQWTCSLMDQFVGSENMVNEIVQFADDDPTKNVDRVSLWKKLGCGEAASVSNGQLYTRTAVASELYKLQFSNVDASGKIIGIRYGGLASTSGLPDVDGAGNGFRFTPYNLTWKLARQLNLQMSTQGVQLGMTSFMIGLGGVVSKSLGFLSYPFLSHSALGWALDPSGWAASGTTIGVSPPPDHLAKLNNLPGNASFDQAYLNLHRSLAILPVNGQPRICLKNYFYDSSAVINGSTLTTAQWLADQTVATSPLVLNGTWIDVIALSLQVKKDLLYSFFWSAAASVPVPGNPATQSTFINLSLAPLKIKIHPIGFALANGTAWGYGAGQQLVRPNSTFATMRPIDGAAGIVKLFYDNVPFSSAGYFQLDASPYSQGTQFTNSPITRFNTKSTNGLLPYLFPTNLYENGGQMSTTNWSNAYKAAAGFDFATSPYNIGGLAPVPR